MRIRELHIAAGLVLAGVAIQCTAQSAPTVARIAPTRGPEGTRVEIAGDNLQNLRTVRVGAESAPFKVINDEQVVAIVPHRAATAKVEVSTVSGVATSPFAFAVSNDPRVPEEVAYKAGYVNPAGRPEGFRAAMLWGIAIADTRVAGYQDAKVEIAETRLACRVDGKEVVLNDDRGGIRGGLYRRNPWFGTEAHEAMPWDRGEENHAAAMPVGTRPEKVWHFWSGSPREEIPEGRFEGCTVRARVRIFPGALLQMGMDYWKDTKIGYGVGGNNREAGVSNWYFASPEWQEVEFTDVGGVKF